MLYSYNLLVSFSSSKISQRGFISILLDFEWVSEHSKQALKWLYFIVFFIVFYVVLK